MPGVKHREKERHHHMAKDQPREIVTELCFGPPERRHFIVDAVQQLSIPDKAKGKHKNKRYDECDQEFFPVHGRGSTAARPMLSIQKTAAENRLILQTGNVTVANERRPQFAFAVCFPSLNLEIENADAPARFALISATVTRADHDPAPGFLFAAKINH